MSVTPDSAAAAAPTTGDDGGASSSPATLSESIRDELNTQFDAAEADDAASAEAPEAQGTAPAPEDTGVSAEGAEALVEDGDGAAVADPSAHDGPPPSTSSDQWTPEQRAVFESLPDDDRATLESWAAELQGGLTPKLQEAAEYRRALDPIQADIRDSGIAPAEVIGQLVSLYQGLSHNPLATMAEVMTRDSVTGSLAGTDQAKQAVAQIAKALKVNLGTAEDDPWQAEDDASSKRIDGLEQELLALRNERDQDRNAAGRQAMASAGDALTTFQQAKNGGGQLAHPHFERVASTMASLMKARDASGRPMATGLPDAYAKAVRLEGLPTTAAPKATPAARAKRAATPRTNGAGPSSREPDPIAEIKHADPRMQARLRIQAELGRQFDAAQ